MLCLASNESPVLRLEREPMIAKNETMAQVVGRSVDAAIKQHPAADVDERKACDLEVRYPIRGSVGATRRIGDVVHLSIFLLTGGCENHRGMARNVENL